MKDIVTELGANKTGINLMDKVFEFERALAKVRESFYVSQFKHIFEIDIKQVFFRSN